MKRKYVILRKKGSQRSFNPERPVMERAIRGGTRSDFDPEPLQDPIDIEIEVDELDDRQRGMLEQEGSKLAPSMPIKLIKPKASQNSDGAFNNIAWGLEAIGATTSKFSGHGVKVAVLDTGIDAQHDAFKGINMTVKNFSHDADAHDSDGHGTHCAGTIFGKEVNGCQIGIAPNIEHAFIGKVFGDQGEDSEAITRAIYWAMDSGANLISMSLGIDYPGYVTRLIQRGYKAPAATSMALEGYRENISIFNHLAGYVRNRSNFIKPCLLIAASGNESERPEYEIAVSPPAASSDIIAVGALDKDLNVAPFSNIKPDLCGPGVDVFSAKTAGGLISHSGTSMATPHVAGVAALWAEKLLSESTFSINTFRNNLLANVKTSGLQAFNMEDYGAGLVQAP